MADAFIQLPADGPGKKLDTEQLTVSGNTVHRERDRIAGAGASEILDIRNTDPGSGDYGAVVRLAAPISPQRLNFSATLTPNGTANWDGPIIANGVTAKLKQVVVCCTSPCRFLIEDTNGQMFCILNLNAVPFTYIPPAGFDATVGDGVVKFRIVVTDLSGQSNSVSATLHYDLVA